MARGRPPTVGREVLISSVLKFKEKIISNESESGVISENSPVWQDISVELGNKIKPTTLHSYVVNNKLNLRTLLLGAEKLKNTQIQSDDEIKIKSDARKTQSHFVLTFAKSEFSDLIIQTSRPYKDKNKIDRIRTVQILQPKKWTEKVAKKIYDDFRLPHGYHFKGSYINQENGSGGFTGHHLIVFFLLYL